MKLNETVNMMNSSDYKERFKAEFYQLKTRIDGLEAMLKKWDDGTLEFKPTCPRGLYNDQLKAMNHYLDILVLRANVEGVEIDFNS